MANKKEEDIMKRMRPWAFYLLVAGTLIFVDQSFSQAGSTSFVAYFNSPTSMGTSNVYYNNTTNATGIGVIPTGAGMLQTMAGNQNISIAKVGGVVYDNYTDVSNVGTTETDLYSYTIPGNMLFTNGDKVYSQYAGSFTGALTSTQRLRAYFGGTQIFDSGALSIGVATNNWNLESTCIRESNSVVRCANALTTNFLTLSALAGYTRVTGLNLSNNQILKITGTSGGLGGASNQITSTLNYVEWKSSQ